MAGLVISTIVFFVASFLLKRKFDEMEIAKGMTRNVTVFAIALAISYCAALLVDLVLGSGHA
jgi:hypothetical protein